MSYDKLWSRRGSEFPQVTWEVFATSVVQVLAMELSRGDLVKGSAGINSSQLVEMELEALLRLPPALDLDVRFSLLHAISFLFHLTLSNSSTRC